MKRLTLLIVAAAFILQGCAYFQPKTKTETEQPGFGKSRSGDLVVTPAETAATLEWGIPYEIPVDISWNAGQKFAVSLAVAENTPDWLKVEILPAIVEPPGRAILKITAAIADASIGTTDLTLLASAYGLRDPLDQTITLTIHRQAGDFELVETAPTTRECRNICGHVDNGYVTFYDILKEKDQFCDDKTAFPESQKIGILSFPLARKGYGFGRTCRVAAIFEANGALSFFNLGLTSRLSRGASLLEVRNAAACWLSPDNSLALIRITDALIPYDVASGRALASPCRSSQDPPTIRLDGTTLTAGNCTWTVK